ncbi:hypothetical protein GO491_12085, partial [Flavobacteriaceae bacterium Ap0902]|nr:hypothetical protein [Flavobacteriaceae bacterium Ap0902]
NHNKITYLYNAQGIKVEKQVITSQKTDTTEYLGSFQYKNQALIFIHQPEGYIDAKKQRNHIIYNYVYHYKDHLGNIRLSYTDANKDGVIANYNDPKSGQMIKEILEENNYYPFGLKHQDYNTGIRKYKRISSIPRPMGVKKEEVDYKFMYNGKELQDELGLNVTAMDFRQYDNALGRFLNPDALSELAPMHTPYRFGFNNPVYWRDPTGLYEYDKDGNVTSSNTAEIDFMLDYLDNGGSVGGLEMAMQDAGFGITLSETVVMGTTSRSTGSGFDWAEAANNARGGVAAASPMFDNYYIGTPRLNKPISFMGNNYYGNGKTYLTKSYLQTNAKLLAKGSIVASVVLEVPEIVDGVKRDGDTIGDETIKETAGVAGGLAGAWAGGLLGAEGGAFAGLLGGPFVEITVPLASTLGGIGGAIVGGIWGEDAVEAVVEAVQNAPSPTQQQIDRAFQQSSSFPAHQPKF